MLPANERLLTIERPAIESRRSVRTILSEVDPLQDSRWEGFLQRHPQASVFHSSAWLEAVRRTYGYKPIAYTTAPPGAALQNGLVFCRVESWLTGRRLVSLPFSDHCEPLLDTAADPQIFLRALEQEFGHERWRYIEIRPVNPLVGATGLFHSASVYCFHQIDLRPNLDTLFHNFHKDSVQRKIRRAEREALTYQDGRSESLLDSFYHLLLLTRRRHRLPPQPRQWFQNLIERFGDGLKIRVASKDGQPVAGIITLRYKDTLVYKYGCSDAQFNALGGTHLLFWRSIQDAKNDGLCVFDLGRTDVQNTGLITFKDRWGASRSTLNYSRYTSSAHSSGVFKEAGEDWKLRLARHMLARAPISFLSAVGDIFYKHIG